MLPACNSLSSCVQFMLPPVSFILPQNAFAAHSCCRHQARRRIGVIHLHRAAIHPPPAFCSANLLLLPPVEMFSSETHNTPVEQKSCWWSHFFALNGWGSSPANRHLACSMNGQNRIKNGCNSPPQGWLMATLASRWGRKVYSLWDAWYTGVHISHGFRLQIGRVARRRIGVIHLHREDECSKSKIC